MSSTKSSKSRESEAGRSRRAKPKVFPNSSVGEQTSLIRPGDRDAGPERELQNYSSYGGSFRRGSLPSQNNFGFGLSSRSVMEVNVTDPDGDVPNAGSAAPNDAGSEGCSWNCLLVMLYDMLIVLLTPVLLLAFSVYCTFAGISSCFAYALCCDKSIIGQRTHKTRILLTFWLLIFTVLYGCYVVFSVCSYALECISKDEAFFASLGVARTFGQLVTAQFLMLVFVVLKPVTNFFEETKTNKFINVVGWRSLHVTLSCQMVFCAVIHAVAHVVRRAKGSKKLPPAYENYELVTGLALFGIVSLMSLSYFVIQLKLTSMDGGKNGMAKSWFRRSHHYLFFLFAFVFCIHSYQVPALVLVLLYWLTYRYSSLDVRYACARVRSGSRYVPLTEVDTDKDHILEIVFEVASVPQLFGYFVTLTHRGVSAPYTVLPISAKLFMVRIAKSTFSLRLLEHLRANDAAKKPVELGADAIKEFKSFTRLTSLPADIFYNFAVDVFGCRVAGFYRSFDYNFTSTRGMPNAKLICFVRGTGRVVSDSVLSFCFTKGLSTQDALQANQREFATGASDAKPNVFSKIVIINASRFPYSSDTPLMAPRSDIPSLRLSRFSALSFSKMLDFSRDEDTQQADTTRATPEGSHNGQDDDSDSEEIPGAFVSATEDDGDQNLGIPTDAGGVYGPVEQDQSSEQKWLAAKEAARKLKKEHLSEKAERELKAKHEKHVSDRKAHSLLLIDAREKVRQAKRAVSEAERMQKVNNSGVATGPTDMSSEGMQNDTGNGAAATTAASERPSADRAANIQQALEQLALAKETLANIQAKLPFGFALETGKCRTMMPNLAQASQHGNEALRELFKWHIIPDRPDLVGAYDLTCDQIDIDDAASLNEAINTVITMCARVPDSSHVKVCTADDASSKSLVDACKRLPDEWFSRCGRGRISLVLAVPLAQAGPAVLTEPALRWVTISIWREYDDGTPTLSMLVTSVLEHPDGWDQTRPVPSFDKAITSACEILRERCLFVMSRTPLHRGVHFETTGATARDESDAARVDPAEEDNVKLIHKASVVIFNIAQKLSKADIEAVVAKNITHGDTEFLCVDRQVAPILHQYFNAKSLPQSLLHVEEFSI